MREHLLEKAREFVADRFDKTPLQVDERRVFTRSNITKCSADFAAQETARLEAKVLRYKTALEHYADERRWQVPLHLDGTEATGRTRYFGMADHGYEVAAAALAEEGDKGADAER